MRVEEEGMKSLMNELATGNNFIFKSSFLELLNLTLVATTNDDEKISLVGAYHKNGITFHFFQVNKQGRIALTSCRRFKRISLMMT